MLRWWSTGTGCLALVVVVISQDGPDGRGTILYVTVTRSPLLGKLDIDTRTSMTLQTDRSWDPRRPLSVVPSERKSRWRILLTSSNGPVVWVTPIRGARSKEILSTSSLNPTHRQTRPEASVNESVSPREEMDVVTPKNFLLGPLYYRHTYVRPPSLYTLPLLENNSTL